MILSLRSPCLPAGRGVSAVRGNNFMLSLIIGDFWTFLEISWEPGNNAG
jgi:hypothetical protein